MTRILAIDPGPLTSGWVLYDGERVLRGTQDDDNSELVDDLDAEEVLGDPCYYQVAIEWVTSYGMRVGAEVFETCRWVGRFEQAAGGATLIPRRDVKLYLCNSAKAKDPDIRRALLERFGGVEGKAKAVGTKANPGPLYGVRSHMWAALGVAVTWWDTRRES